MTERSITVRIVGDAGQLQRALGTASNSLKAFGGDAAKAAEAQVQAGVESREALTALAKEYETLAKAAAKGSDAQIVAAAKAADANAKLAASTKISSAETTSAFSRSSAGAGSFVKSMLGFVAAYAGFEGLKASISAIMGAQASMAKLDQAVKNAHASISSLTPVIEAHEAAERKLGFTDDDTREATAKLVTAFGATKQAFGELSIASDLARQKGEDLGFATQQLIQLQEGNTRAAKQLGVVIPDLTAKQWEAKAAVDGLTEAQEKGKVAYDELTPRIRDQAQAFAQTDAGKVAEFQAQVQHLEETVGQDLLPIMNRYLNGVDDWLSKSDNQKRVTKDVDQVVNDLAGALRDTEAVVREILPYVDGFVKSVGGWQTVIEAVIALKFAKVLGGWADDMKNIASGAAGLVKGIGSIGGAAAAAEPEVAALEGTLLGLAGIGAIAIPITIYEMVVHSAPTHTVKSKFGGDDIVNPEGNQVSSISVGKGAGVFGIGTPAQVLPTIAGIGNASPRDRMRGAAADGRANAAIAAAIAKKATVFGPPVPTPTGGGGGGSTHKVVTVKIPDALKAKIVAAQAEFSKDVTKGHLDALDSLLKQEEQVIEGQKGASNEQTMLASVKNAVTTAGKKLQAAIAKQQLDVAKKTIAQLEAETTGPEQTLKLATATNAPVAEVLSDQQNLLGAYQTEAAQLKVRLAASTGKAKTAYAAALTKAQTGIASTQDAIASSLETIASDAQTKLQSVLGTIEQAADTALGNEYFQNGLQTPAEAELASMQAADTVNSLNDTLTQAQQQLATDQAASADSGTLATDQAAIDAAQRAITENNLATQATAERAQADSAFAKAEYNLNTAIETLSTNVGTGAGLQDALNNLLAPFGISLASLTDPGGNQSLPTLQAAIAATTLAFANLKDYIDNLSFGSTDPADQTAAQAAAAQVAAFAAAGYSAGAIARAGIGTGGALDSITVPHLARGGIVSRPTLVLAGEAGREAITPLGDSTGIGDPVEIHFHGGTFIGSTPEQVARDLKPHLDRIVSSNR